jgi:hypothetical protein
MADALRLATVDTRFVTALVAVIVVVAAEPTTRTEAKPLRWRPPEDTAVTLNGTKTKSSAEDQWTS